MKKQLKAIYNVSQENNLSSVKVEPVFETRGYSGTNRQVNGFYWSNRGQTIVIVVAKEGVDLVEAKQIITFMVVGGVFIMS